MSRLILPLYCLFLLLLTIPSHTLSLPTITTPPKHYSCTPSLLPLGEPVRTASYRNCIRVILAWGTVDGRDKPTTFSHDLSRAYQLPHSVILGNCVDLEAFAAGYQIASFADVAQVAGRLAQECVEKEPHMGGIAFLDYERFIEVLLLALDLGDRLVVVNSSRSGLVRGDAMV